jgi:DNA polymerase III delta prime subunit
MKGKIHRNNRRSKDLVIALPKIYYFAGMKRYNFIFLFLLFAFYGCSNDDNKKKNEKAENDIDAAREFIRSALDGKFTEARAYILADSVNLQYLYEHDMDAMHMSPNNRDSLK